MSKLTQQTRRVLFEKIDDHFSNSDLQQLCFLLNVDYDNLLGSGKATKLRELIIECERGQKVEDLIEQCRLMRPNVEYPHVKHLNIKEKAKVISPSQSRILSWVIISIVIVLGLTTLFTTIDLPVQVTSIFSQTVTPLPTKIPCNAEIIIDGDKAQLLVGQTISLIARASGSNLQLTWLTDYGAINNSSSTATTYIAPPEPSVSI